MKKCTICKKEKELIEFNKRKSAKSGHQSSCKECSKITSKKYYHNDREKHIRKIYERKENQKLINRIKIYEFYQNNPCVDCGNNNPIVLECDHRDGVNKIERISYMVNTPFSWKKIEEEIKKCDVRCANCHRIRTSIQQGWYKYII